MALITFDKKRPSSGGYSRLVGDKKLAELLTAIHAGLISTGTQVSLRLQKSYIGSLPIINGNDVNTPKKTLNVLKKHQNGCILFNCFVKRIDGDKQEIDVLIYDGIRVYVYEIKDGNSLDTKKSEKEIDGIEYAVNSFKNNNYETTGGLILMHMTDKNHSIKDERSEKYVISGKEFCKKFLFDFDRFNEFQKNEVDINKETVLNKMLEILKENGKV